MRRKLAIVLVMAFLALLAAPVRAGWGCPDGTPCVRRHGRYVCLRESCGSHASCCKVRKTCECRHGDLPGLVPEKSATPQLGGTEHCRFSIWVPVHPRSAAQPAGLPLNPAIAVLPAPVAVELTLPAADPVWRAEYTLGYRPPPDLSTGPSRAPPHREG